MILRGMHRTDEKLVSDYLSGDRAALDVLIQHYLKPIYHFAYRMVGNAHDAEDITQDTFVKAWRHIKRFDERKSFKTWVFSIAKNTALDFLKKKKTVPFSAFENAEGDNVLIDGIADAEPLPPELFDRADLAEFLAATVQKLSSEHRMVLVLHYNEQLNFREIAEVLREPLHTVKSRHRRAIIALRALLLS